MEPGQTYCIDAALAAGPGSAEQQQLHSLLCTLLKAAVRVGPEGTSQQREQAKEVVNSVAPVVAAQLKFAAAAAPAAVPPQQSHSRVAGSSSASSVPASSSCSDSAMHAVPWLNLLGRCASWFAGRMRSEQGVLPFFKNSSDSVLAYLDVIGVAAPLKQCKAAAEAVISSSIPLQLMPHGYNFKPVLQLLLSIDVDRAAQGRQPGQLPEPFIKHMVSGGQSLNRMMRQMQEVGAVLSSLPVKDICNSPKCHNMEGYSESEVVVGMRAWLLLGTLTQLHRLAILDNMAGCTKDSTWRCSRGKARLCI